LLVVASFLAEGGSVEERGGEILGLLEILEFEI
jgi:hypothetical protein